MFPAATFVLGDTAEEARDKAHYIRRQQVSGPTAIAMLEQVWGRDLSEYDPDGPLPEDDPTGDTSITQGRVRHGDPIEVARRYRERAEAEHLSIRELIIAVTSREQFVGTAESCRRGDRPLHPGRRVRRVHPGAASDSARSGRVRRPRGAAAAGTFRVPYRIQRHHAARASRAGSRALARPSLEPGSIGATAPTRSLVGWPRGSGRAIDRRGRAPGSRYPAGPVRPGCGCSRPDRD